MSFFPGDSRVLGPLFGTPPAAAVFSDEAYLSRLIEVEVALARAQGQLGIIPSRAAKQIVSRAPSLSLDIGRIGQSTQSHGLPVIELVSQLREHVGPDAAPFVHWGATSQDVMDTGLVLQLRDAQALLEADLKTVMSQLAELAAIHRDTLVAGRTRSQQALPTTFGLKVAAWLAPLLRHRSRARELGPRLFVVQLGGGVGTLASMGAEGPDLIDALAADLGLGVPLLPWHTQRDGLAELAGWLSMVTASLGKMAQDIVLMAQTEVGELAESDSPARGGSSTMPHKNNPVRSEAIVAAARQNAALLGSVHQAQLQEHERGGPGWQLEWLTVPQMIGLTSGALGNAVHLTRDLQVRPDRMRANVDASHGLLLAEAASLLLARHLPREEAKTVVREAGQVAIKAGTHLIDVLKDTVGFPVDWSHMEDESNYLGAAGKWVDEVVRQIHDG